MSNKLSFALTFVFAATIMWTTTIHQFNVPNIEGGSQALSSYQGKRILVITLPLVQSSSADSLLYALDTLASARSNTLKVIAVPAYEDGYTPAQKAGLQQWYRSKLRTNIIITEGLYTRKTSGAQQHALFKWLTKVSENENFDIDVSGPGYKFFTKENGELYSVLQPFSRIGGGSVQKTLEIQ